MHLSTLCSYRAIRIASLILIQPLFCAAAEGIRKSFAVPSGPAATTLRIFAEQAGGHLLYSAEAVAGVTTKAVKGSYAPPDALDLMLDGTPLLGRWDGTKGALTVTRRSKAVEAAAQALSQGAADQGDPVAETKRATGTSDEAVQLSVFNVTEERDTGYESMQTTAGMRTVEELKNVANSISIMNAQLIEDTASLTIEEMSTWFVSGESDPEPAALVPGRVYLRGIRNSYSVRNGLIAYSQMDAYSTERIEVVRGPNAFLYGESDVGGSYNQATKRGRFTKDINKARLILGSWGMQRAEVDFNRRLVPDKLAVRITGVQSYNDSWIDYARRDFRAVYGAITYRPTRTTEISLMAEYAKTTAINPQGLFLDQYSRRGTSTITASGGYIYVPATGLMYRAQGTGRISSTGPGTTVVESEFLPRAWQDNGPTATYKNNPVTINLEMAQQVGQRLFLQLSGGYYKQKVDTWAVSSRNLYRDLNPRLPNGQSNPYYNELYREYFRTRNIWSNTLRDLRFAAVYNLETKWTNQRLLAYVQQHQDTPGGNQPKWGEYLDPSNPAWTGVINNEITQAAFSANRTVFTNNRFMRRYYLKDGTKGSADLGPIPGLSAWYPDLSNQVSSSGQDAWRRFYTPSWGVGASGNYFKQRLFTTIGYRSEHYNMRWSTGTVRPLRDQWVIDVLPTATNPNFSQYKMDGANFGAILRLHESFALGYNYAQSYRLSSGEGNLSFRVGERQGLYTGEGEDLSARFSLLKGRLEFSVVRYHNYTPNARIAPNPPVAVRDEVSALFPETFYASGQDRQTTTTEGYEFEAVANPFKNWRIAFNFAKNKVITENRLPLLKGFQAEAKALNRPTPELDAFLLQFPEGLPNAGYTKFRLNLFTRYTFAAGPLKGAYLGGGVNYRQPTYRGTADLDGVASTPPDDLWSPAYSVYSLLAGYGTKIFKRPTSFSLNISNLLDKDYYRSAGIGSGSWGDPRSWRLSISSEF